MLRNMLIKLPSLKNADYLFALWNILAYSSIIEFVTAIKWLAPLFPELG